MKSDGILLVYGPCLCLISSWFPEQVNRLEIVEINITELLHFIFKGPKGEV